MVVVESGATMTLITITMRRKMQIEF